MFFSLKCLLFIVPIYLCFVVDNRIGEGNKEVKAFTFFKKIKGNDCTCSCLCAPPTEASQLVAPSAPNSLLENQFNLVKIVRNKICDCSCSCSIETSTSLNKPLVESSTNQSTNFILASKKTTPIITSTQPSSSSSKKTTPIITSTQPSTTFSNSEKTTPIITSKPPSSSSSKKTTPIITSTQPSSSSSKKTTITSTKIPKMSKNRKEDDVQLSQSVFKNATNEQNKEEGKSMGAFFVAIEEQNTTTTKMIESTTTKMIESTTNLPIKLVISNQLNENSNQIKEEKDNLAKEKQLQIQQAKNWHNFLLERANVRQRAIANIVEKPKVEEIGTTTKSPPFNCASIHHFVDSFGIKDPSEWIHKNCDSLKQNFPNASCDQISRIFLSCFDTLNKE